MIILKKNRNNSKLVIRNSKDMVDMVLAKKKIEILSRGEVYSNLFNAMSRR